MKIIITLFVVLALGILGLFSIQQRNPESLDAVGQYVNTMTTSVDKAKDLNRLSYTANMSNRGLTEFPFELLDQTSIKFLDLSNNRLTSLPSELGKLTALEELNVSGNRLTGALPAEIRQLTRLKVLNAANNNLTGIPAEIGQMTSVEIIDFSNNKLDTYPLELENISSNLKQLSIVGNAYSPDQIEAVRNMLPTTIVRY